MQYSLARTEQGQTFGITEMCIRDRESAVTKPKTGTKMTALPTHKILRQVFFFLMGCVFWLSGCFSCSDIVIP